LDFRQRLGVHQPLALGHLVRLGWRRCFLLWHLALFAFLALGLALGLRLFLLAFLALLLALLAFALSAFAFPFALAFLLVLRRERERLQHLPQHLHRLVLLPLAHELARLPRGREYPLRHVSQHRA